MKARALPIALFGLGLLVAVAWMPWSMDGAETLRWATLAVGLPLLLVLLGGDIAPFPWLPAAFVAFAAASLAWSPDFLGGVDELARIVILFAAFWLGTSLRNAQHLWSGLALGVAASAAIALAQVAGWEGIPQSAPPAGLFGNRIYLAEAGLVALITSLAIVSWPARVFAVAGLIAMVICGSKAALAGAAIALAFWFAPRRPWAAWGIMGAVALLAVWLFAGGHPSAEARLDIWAPAIAGLSPLGHGVSAFAGTFPEPQNAHNELVQLAYDFGLPGIIILGLVLASALARWEGQVEGYVLVALCVVALFSSPLHYPLTGLALALACGRLAGARVVVGQFRRPSRLVLGGVGAR